MDELPLLDFAVSPARAAGPNFAPGSVILDAAPSNALVHRAHPGCCLTSAFEAVVGPASVAVLVLDQAGYFIYANDAAQDLLAYDLAELTSKHVFDLVEAEAGWVASELEHLARYQTWSGRVLLRRPRGDLLKVSANAFTTSLPDGGAEHVAFLHPTFPDGPAIVRLPETGIEYGLTAQDLALLHLMSEGFSDEEIAGIRGGRAATIRDEISAVREKLKASSRTEAAVVALRERLLV